MRCKMCGFMVKDSGYFDPMPKGTPVPVNEHALFMVKKGVLADGELLNKGNCRFGQILDIN